MYIPHVFAELDESEIKRVIGEHPLAVIAYRTELELDAQHVPLIFDGEHRLIGHVSIDNDITKSLKDGDEVLAIFSGQDSYISPNWYPTKAEHHQHVPTWNYQKVHVYGRINFLMDEKANRAVVGKMTKYFEARTNGEHAWKMSDAPAAYINKLLTQLVSFEILVDRITAKSKVGQNRVRADYDAVISRMEADGLSELSSRMKSLKEVRE